MNATELEDLLKVEMGLNAASIGSSAIERAVQERLLICKVIDANAYCEFVRGSAAELQELIEAIVVPETWFFRDRDAFSALARIAHEWLRTHPEGVLRTLSLPCSTGEEPYSMVMALIDSGFPRDRFCVDALDISERALALARRATYGKNSFRGNDFEFRDRHFELTDHGYRLADKVRHCVQFQHGNMFAADFLPGAGTYDAIFCRNVLIYFDRATQDRAIKVLDRLLTANGVLFVGPAESGLLLNYDFTSAKLPMSFAFRKAASRSRDSNPSHEKSIRPVAAIPPVARIAPTTAGVHNPWTKPIVPIVVLRSTNSDADTDTEQIVRLADQGRLVEAAKCCDEHLQKHGPSAAAFYLMGLIRDASGNLADACHYYRKALYLDPSHHESLLHLAFLLDKQGDVVGAQVLRTRARRLQVKVAT
jgi:chemotaxis protein methyltransferase WspC